MRICFIEVERREITHTRFLFYKKICELRINVLLSNFSERYERMRTSTIWRKEIAIFVIFSSSVKIRR